MAKVTFNLSFSDIKKNDNIAEILTKEERAKVATMCLDELKIDQESRSEWDQKTADALKLCQQLEMNKIAIEGQADIKFPLTTIAVIQLAARVYPEFIRDNRVVNMATTGDDPDGSREGRSTRVSNHMSWQLLVESPEWEEGFDRLLHTWSLIGMVFKKTYYDPIERRNISRLCLPESISINQCVESVESARRISHLTPMYMNEIIERIRYGIFCDCETKLVKDSTDVPDAYLSVLKTDKDEDFDKKDDDRPRTILEQHRYLDLDGDGYQEPYIVMLDVSTREVLRIAKRFSEDTIEETKDGTIRKIGAKQYFTAFPFIPAMDGTFWALGFGQLLLSANKTINTTINQLLDAGTMSNGQNGFLGAEFRSSKGPITLGPREWKCVGIPGSMLKDSIVPLPVREPSNVLFQLLGIMMDFGKELTACPDIMQGKQDAVIPPTTVVQLITQGMKVYSAIMKRLYRSLTSEFRKLYLLNSEHLEDTTYMDVMNSPQAIKKIDYNPQQIGVAPIADPCGSSDMQRVARANALMQILPQLNLAGQRAGMTMWLEALQFPSSQILKILPPIDPTNPTPPPPETVKTLAEADLLHVKTQTALMESQLKNLELQMKQDEITIKKVLAANKTVATQHQGHKQEAQAALDLAKISQDHTHHYNDMSLELEKLKHDHIQHAAEMAMELTKVKAELEKERIKSSRPSNR